MMHIKGNRRRTKKKQEIQPGKKRAAQRSERKRVGKRVRS